MLYLLVLVIIGALIYIGWRALRAQGERPSPRVIGPDDDPDFLRDLGRDPEEPRDRPQA